MPNTKNKIPRRWRYLGNAKAFIKLIHVQITLKMIKLRGASILNRHRMIRIPLTQNFFCLILTYPNTTMVPIYAYCIVCSQ